MLSSGNGSQGFALNDLWRALTARVSPERLALAAFLCLLIAAAALRFYDLPGNSAWLDEAAAANLSRGTIREVVSGTRGSNSAPILYPLALWAVQKVESTPLSIRVLPAAASLLTVAVMLFLLPRLGVSRRAAFLAALLTTLSVAAIEQAQDAREYSIDALLAVLMIAGLLWYLRDGRKALLCVSLFLAPLLQYGLVLFGAAVIAAAMLLLPQTLTTAEGNSYPGRIRNWLKSRIALLWPAACFLAGCATSYAATLRHQWQQGGWGSGGYLSPYYYQEKFDAAAIFEFSVDGIWNLLTYHLPDVVAIAALTAFAILLGAAILRKFRGKLQDNAITVLFSLCIAVSVAAALLSIYPLGDVRQVIYLGPIVFLAVGIALHWIAGSLAALTRRAWMAPVLTVAAAGAIALAGVGTIRQDSPYETRYDAKAVLAFLEENVQEEDIVYVTGYAAPSMRFYQPENPSNYYYQYYGKAYCAYVFEPCLRALADLVSSLPNVPNRIFVAHQSGATWPTVSGWTETTASGEKNGRTHRVQTDTADPIRTARLELLGEQVSVEGIITDGIFNISMITYPKESFELAARSSYQSLVSGEPAIRSTFDVYLNENTLTYVKESCVRADTEATFFLHLYPVDVNDLPDRRKQHGFDNLDFDFSGRGAISDGKCMARISLPEYDIATIGTGQYVPVAGGYNHLWKGEIPLDE